MAREVIKYGSIVGLAILAIAQVSIYGLRQGADPEPAGARLRVGEEVTGIQAFDASGRESSLATGEVTVLLVFHSECVHCREVVPFWPDEELSDHLEACPSCRAQYRLLQELPAAFHPDVEVPEALIQRVMANIAVAFTTEAAPRVPVLQPVIGGVLGSITAVAAVLASGTAHVDDPTELLLFFLGVGLATCLFQLRSMRSLEQA